VFSVGCETAKKIPDTIAFSTPICFEDTVPKVIRELIWDGGKRKVDLLINLSNDGWFGNDDGARIQHVREARMRCIENMTPMLRSVNTGMSCSINQSGDVREVASIHGKVAIRKPSVMSARVFAFNGLPLSRFVGDSVAWLSLIGSILLVIGSCKKWSKDSNEGS
jgi:apolipoprotein N-acyltransferase